MIKIRRAEERGYANHGWLDTYHTFSFAHYYDPANMGFRVLRVINEDRIQGGMGFPFHGHRDMEIITIVISGALEHKDTLGHSTVIRPGEVQRMSAGTGIRHSEFNHLPDTETHLLQIWLLPEQNGCFPGYGQKSFVESMTSRNFVLAVSKEGRDDSIAMNQDADVYLGKLKEQEVFDVRIRSGRHGWLQLVSGEVMANSEVVRAGDGLACSDEDVLRLKAHAPSDFIFFDLP